MASAEASDTSTNDNEDTSSSDSEPNVKERVLECAITANPPQSGGAIRRLCRAPTASTAKKTSRASVKRLGKYSAHPMRPTVTRPGTPCPSPARKSRELRRGNSVTSPMKRLRPASTKRLSVLGASPIVGDTSVTATPRTSRPALVLPHGKLGRGRRRSSSVSPRVTGNRVPERPPPRCPRSRSAMANLFDSKQGAPRPAHMSAAFNRRSRSATCPTSFELLSISSPPIPIKEVGARVEERLETQSPGFDTEEMPPIRPRSGTYTKRGRSVMIDPEDLQKSLELSMPAHFISGGTPLRPGKSIIFPQDENVPEVLDESLACLTSFSEKPPAVKPRRVRIARDGTLLRVRPRSSTSSVDDPLAGLSRIPDESSSHSDGGAQGAHNFAGKFLTREERLNALVDKLGFQYSSSDSEELNCDSLQQMKAYYTNNLEYRQKRSLLVLLPELVKARRKIELAQEAKKFVTLANTLKTAINIGATKRAKDLITKHPKLLDIAIAQSRNTPLHLAAASNNVALVEHLLKLGADVCPRNRDNLTPYTASNNPNIRRAFQRFAQLNPDKFDYAKARIPTGKKPLSFAPPPPPKLISSTNKDGKVVMKRNRKPFMKKKNDELSVAPASEQSAPNVDALQDEAAAFPATSRADDNKENAMPAQSDHNSNKKVCQRVLKMFNFTDLEIELYSQAYAVQAELTALTNKPVTTVSCHICAYPPCNPKSLYSVEGKLFCSRECIKIYFLDRL